MLTGDVTAFDPDLTPQPDCLTTTRDEWRAERIEMGFELPEEPTGLQLVSERLDYLDFVLDCRNEVKAWHAENFAELTDEE